MKEPVSVAMNKKDRDTVSVSVILIMLAAGIYLALRFGILNGFFIIIQHIIRLLSMGGA
jgi:hypothetical protein